jgi:hypothetical protein
MLTKQDILLFEIKKKLEVLEKNLLLNSDKDFYTLEEACYKLGMSRAHLYNIRKKGVIKSLKREGKIYITHKAIKDFIDNN